jgi:hypothetical protein
VGESKRQEKKRTQAGGLHGGKANGRKKRTQAEGLCGGKADGRKKENADGKKKGEHRPEA